MRRFFGKPDKPWLIASIIACALLLGALFVPLWRMELVAPQYPKGLVMYAYGFRFRDSASSPYDDVREINELNHYIGMRPIKAVNEMKLFIPGVLALAAATLIVPFIAWHKRWFRALVIGGYWTMPLFFLADLQWWLYHYGHTMDPGAALNTGSFTPRVVGSTKVWNFHSETQLQTGFYLMAGAALVITFVPLAFSLFGRWRARRITHRTAEQAHPHAAGRGIAAAAVLAVAGLATAAGVMASPARVQAQADSGASLQQRIDAAAPEDIIIVEGGTYHEAIHIDKAVSLIGRGSPVIDGGGQGDVVTISAGDAVISGFTIRGGGKNISQEPAAIKVDGADHVTIRSNTIRDAHFGIHITDSADDVIENNTIDAGADTPIERRGHAVYLWEVTGATLYGNTIRHAGDGIHLEYADRNTIGHNTVTGSRYAMHLMYANGNKVVGNTFTDNLAGAVVMYSKDLILNDNELSGNRQGASGAGVLLKDADNIWLEGNRIMRNKIGITADGTPQAPGSTAIFQRNLLALNDTGIGLMSNAPITFVENAMIDNTVQVKALSGDLSAALPGHGGGAAAGAAASSGSPAVSKGAVWASQGRGNYWSDYHGYDANGDGVGDQPYQPRPPFAGRLANEDTLRLFQFTPAQQAIDAAADMFPLYNYHPVIEDSGPLMEPPQGAGLAHDGGVNLRLLGVSALLLAGALVAAARLASLDITAGLRRAWAGVTRRRGVGASPA